MPDHAAAALARHMADEHKIGRLQEYLKQIVYGGNDGIVTTFSVVAGFAGFGSEGAATVGGVAVLLFGLANLFADGTAMGLGEFLSSLSERDVYRSERARELARDRARAPTPRRRRRPRCSGRARHQPRRTRGRWPRSCAATPSSWPTS